VANSQEEITAVANSQGEKTAVAISQEEKTTGNSKNGMIVKNCVSLQNND
jgi:hypothetical protein